MTRLEQQQILVTELQRSYWPNLIGRLLDWVTACFLIPD